LTFAAILFVGSTAAQAQSNRTWVSATGADSGTCTFASPCRTFQYALGWTTNQGQINALSDGDFGVVTVNKSVTIDGTGHLVSINTGNSQNAITFTPSTTGDVLYLRSIQLDGNHQGGTPSAYWTGINFTGTGGALVVQDCSIANFSANGVNVNTTNGGEVYVRDSTLTNNEIRGIVVNNSGSGTAVVSIDNVRLTNNGKYATGTGFEALNGVRGTIRDAIISGSGYAGISVVGTNANPSSINVESSVVHNNGAIGIAVGFGTSANGTVRLSNVDIFDNNGSNYSYAVGQGTVISFGNNRSRGNLAENPPSLTVSQM
jgi:hypothetical protein